MKESLLGFILTRLDQFEAPVFLHRELEKFSIDDIATLIAEGLLRESAMATEIPRPAHLPLGGDLIVRKTSRGLFGVADEDDYVAPVPLTDDDVRQYEVSLPKLVSRFRQENDIDGTGFENHNGLVSLGLKTIDSLGTADVYLAFPNDDESVLLSRCRRLDRPTSSQRVVLVTPRGLAISPEGRKVLDSAGVVLASMALAASKGGLALDWNNLVGRPDIGPSEAYPRETRIFKNQGRTWLLVYDGDPRSVGDSVGMAYISRLIQCPGQEMHSVSLRNTRAGDGQTEAIGSAGDVLDERTLREYREHLKDLQGEITEAENNHDIGTVERLKEELEAITAEVGRATGLGGRNRRAADDRERARQAVSVAIRRAMKAIKKEHEPLWQHLQNSLQIGEFLSYQPDQPTFWIT